MKRVDLIYKTLLDLPINKGIDANTLASMLNISRANVSHVLNTLCKEGKVSKSNGRPVLFYINESLSSLKNKTNLDKLANNNISLKDAIEHAKASILYPPNGMNCLILGETGVGKSMFAYLMHEYAIEMQVKNIDSPFITFNCADYSNNPQLLTSQLFGVKKGAYTGAEIDKIGLIEKANNGILFLDEIHRLPPEGQEALFTFLDTGLFRRVGDHENRQSNALIISATTENPDSTLLKTFTRRIPMTITIPALKQRTLEERFYLIKSFFKAESIKIKKDIFISVNAMRALLSYDCPNNIGQLKSDIQLICARAYSEYLTHSQKDIRVEIKNTPTYIKEGLYKEKNHRVLWNRLIGEDIDYIKISSLEEVIIEKYKDNHIYENIKYKVDRLKAEDVVDINMDYLVDKEVITHFRKDIEGVSEYDNGKMLENFIDEDVLEFIKHLIHYINCKLEERLKPNMCIAMALHINNLIHRVKNDKIMVNTNVLNLETKYKKEYDIAVEIKARIEKYLKKEIPLGEVGYLCIFLIEDGQLKYKQNDKVKVIVIAHGDSTASSIVDVTNRLLGQNYTIALDSPIDIKPSYILNELKNIIKENPSKQGYLILVDMGSLVTFGEIIENEFHTKVKIISLVSTLHVLEATRKAMLGYSLEDVYSSVKRVNYYIG